MRRWATTAAWTALGGVLAGSSWFSAPGFGGAWTTCGCVLTILVAALAGLLAHAMTDIPEDVKEQDHGSHCRNR